MNTSDTGLNGEIYDGESVNINVEVNAEDIMMGDYMAHIFVSTNIESTIDENIIDIANKLFDWNYVLDKNSLEAGIYIQWEREIMNYFYMFYVPEEVINLLYVQLYTIIKKIKSLKIDEKTKFLNQTLITAINKLNKKFGNDSKKWIYGQKNYKHVKTLCRFLMNSKVDFA